MSKNVIAGISHKGGTGRSITLANLAYQLHRKGPANVCIVDLDLASPTMGAVLELPQLEGGADKLGSRGSPRSVYDLLLYPDDPSPALVDIRSKSPYLKPVINRDRLFSLLPGLSPQGDWKRDHKQLRENLRHLVANLRKSNFDYIILDIRSGISDVLDALHEGSEDLVDMAIVHFRWTPQQLVGLKSLVDSEVLQYFEDKVRFIRTAYTAPEQEDDSLRDFASALDQQLRQQLRAVKWQDRELNPDRPPFLGTVPMDPKLRWKECVLTKNDLASASALQEFNDIADKIIAELN